MFLPCGHLQSPGVTGGFSIAVSTAVEELLMYRPILLSTETLYACPHKTALRIGLM